MPQSQINEFPEIFKSVKKVLSGVLGGGPELGLPIFDNFSLF